MKVKVTGLVKYAGKWQMSGDIITDVPEEIGKQMISQDVAEEIKKTPAEIAAEEEEARRATEESAAKKEAEKQIKALRKKAAELGIGGAAEIDADTLVAEIAAVEKK